MRIRGLLSLLLSGALLLTGCSADGANVSQSRAPEESHRLVVYTSHKEEVYWPIVKEFEERTGIWVEVVTGGTNELLGRISDEAEHPVADVMFGGGVESLECYRDFLTPYTCAEAETIPARFRATDDLWTPFSCLPVVLIYNTKLVSPGQVTGWEDLLSPSLQGRIAFTDPCVSGSCFTGLVTMLYALGGDYEVTLRQFAENLDGRQAESSGAVLDSVADGTDLVGVTLEETALRRIAAGADLAMVYPKEGTSAVPDGGAIVKGAPHEENARQFLDFTAGEDVQRLLTNRFYRRSVRSDVEPLPELAELTGLPMMEYDVGWASQNHDSVIMAWAFYLGGEEIE